MKSLLYVLTAIALLFPSVAAAETGAGAEETDASVITVRAPDKLDFKIDPYNIAGRGQIYSELFSFTNAGETDLLLTFADVRAVLPNDADYLLADQPIGLAFAHEKKAVYLALDFEGSFGPPVVVTAGHAPDASFLLPAGGGAASFSIVGSVNDDLNNPWYDGELKISVTYCFEPMISQGDAAQEDAAQEEPEQTADESVPGDADSENAGFPEGGRAVDEMPQESETGESLEAGGDENGGGDREEQLPVHDSVDEAGGDDAGRGDVQSDSGADGHLSESGGTDGDKPVEPADSPGDAGGEEAQENAARSSDAAPENLPEQGDD
jgi:hypothetical protein